MPGSNCKPRMEPPLASTRRLSTIRWALESASMPFRTFLLPACIAASSTLIACVMVSETSNSTYGIVRENAIEVCHPQGEHEYLSKLACADGNAPEYRLLGNAGTRTDPTKEFADKLKRDDKVFEMLISPAPIPPGEPDIHIVDVFEIKCRTSTTKLYFDRYHCSEESKARLPLAPRGFQIRTNGQSSPRP